ncbi:MAG: cysteine desulfurase family protein [Anaerolineaceae bacterium]
MNRPANVYLDYAATTPVDKRVLHAMLPYFSEDYGNPSSAHWRGQQAEAAVDQARKIVAECLGAKREEVIFTSCGSESDNLALRGSAFARRKKCGANHILISPVEHHAVLHTAEQLAKEFEFELELLPVDKYGMVHPEELAKRLRPDTAVVSVMYANNEIGTINPIAEIAQVCRQKGVIFHSDAVQAAAHLPIDFGKEGIDLLAIGAHKFYGPKGVGALLIQKDTDLLPTLTGGKQENGLRAGTHNVPLIVGLAEALALTKQDEDERAKDAVCKRDFLISEVLKRIPDTRLTGHPEKRLPNHASFVFHHADGNLLLILLDAAGFEVSSGSACKVGNPKPSDVLLAAGIPADWALGSLRVTLGRDTPMGDLDAFLDVLPGAVEKARKK